MTKVRGWNKQFCLLYNNFKEKNLFLYSFVSLLQDSHFKYPLLECFLSINYFQFIDKYILFSSCTFFWQYSFHKQRGNVTNIQKILGFISQKLSYQKYLKHLMVIMLLDFRNLHAKFHKKTIEKNIAIQVRSYDTCGFLWLYPMFYFLRITSLRFDVL